MHRAPGGKRRSAAHLLVVVGFLSMAACSTLPPGSLDRIVHGPTIEGRMSVHYTDLASGKDDASSGRFVWTTDDDRLELSLLDPLGQTVALIRSDARRSSIVLRDGRRFDGETPEALTEKALGWSLPLHGLGDWLDGRPERGSTVTTLADGRIIQDGWTIRFQRDDAGDRPKRIDLAYPGPPVAVDLRLVVDDRSGP